ncbi:lamin tail domain-containing protein [Streptomyces sp. NPDC092296]|uniref:lamin tail domain-containing protein n=1 Tax=Streptomyces sp. NPDC092296 TaxID=3366012 RepID=UPI0038155680
MYARRIASTLIAATAVVAALGAGTAQAAGPGHHPGVGHSGPVHAAPIHHRAVVELGQVHRDGNPSREWITLTNTGSRTVELRGWTLSDRDRHSFRLGGVRLRGHQSVRVHTGHGRDTGRDVYGNQRRSIWDRADTATLRDGRGHAIDQESWGGRLHR